MALKSRHVCALSGCILGIALLPASPAAAFFCYLPEKPAAPYALRDKPSDTAKIIARMPAGGMVRAVPRVKERNGHAYVTWMSDQAIRKVTGRGWVNTSEIHGGECED